MKLLIHPIIWITFACGAYGDEMILGKRLTENFPESDKTYSDNDIRDNIHLRISEVISHSDAFLKKSFGENFNPITLAVCHTSMRVKKGEIWCWVVSYQHPGNGEGEADVLKRFRVYLSTDGTPLMKVSDK